MAEAEQVKKQGYAKLSSPDRKFQAILTKLKVTLGRDQDTDGTHIQLPQARSISRKHAEIYYDQDAFYIKCMSKNSLCVNKMRLNHDDKPVKLFSQCPIKIGNLEFYFLLPKESNEVSK